MSEPKPIVIADLRGGRNGTDPPLSLPFNQCVEAINIDWKDTAFAHKRGGSIAVSTTGGTAFSFGLQTLLRHVPGNADSAAELWGVDNNVIVKRLTAGTAWVDVTLDDTVATSAQAVVGASLNGKLFLAYDTAQDRLHCYDPNLASPRVRRSGLATPAAPTAANQGVGAYAAVLRYYRVRWARSLNGFLQYSEGGPSVSFTPSGAALSVRITRPTPPGEGETHWGIEASADNATWNWLYTGAAFGSQYFTIATTDTTGFDDTFAVTVYATHTVAEPAGYYGLFPSVKYLISDGNRLLGMGSWESSGATSGGKNSRVWFTPVLGSADKGDDERVMMTTTQKNYVDLNENDGGFGTGLGGPLNGVPYAFKYRAVIKLRPTSDVTAPYLPRVVRNDIGCISHKSIALGEDHIGRAALYFVSHRGPYRVNLDGDVQYLGRDNEDIWRTLNLGATSVVCHSVYYPDLHQWWVWIATGSNNDPDTKMMFDVQLGYPDEHGQIRGGWSKHTGDSAGARCACLFSNTLGASMSKDLKPHLGRSTGTTIFRCDTSDLDDNSAAYQAYVTSRPLLTTVDLLKKVGIEESTLITKAQAATNLTVTINRDFGKETRAQTVSIAAVASETRVIQKVGASEMGEADVVQMTIGDASALANTWTVDAVITPVKTQERR